MICSYYNTGYPSFKWISRETFMVLEDALEEVLSLKTMFPTADVQFNNYDFGYTISLKLDNQEDSDHFMLLNVLNENE